jgi:hypothetical protein
MGYNYNMEKMCPFQIQGDAAMRILNKLSFLGILVSAVFFLASCGGDGGSPPATPNLKTFNATLTLAQEIPAPVTPTGATPSGSGSITLDLTTKTITGSFTTTNVVGATAAHIHDGDTGVAGPVIIGLAQTTPGVWGVPAIARALTDAEIARLQAGGYYVNVHTTLNATGEIRGQLVPAN